jgi:PTH1 family peptidyl-tRNA hydrolase
LANTEDRVFVGIGNPGKTYERTRHNLGFLVIEKLAEEQGWLFKEKKSFEANIAKGEGIKGKVYLLMPLTYVNESGRAVRAFLNQMKLDSRHLTVICDDTALAFGSIRLRAQGSSGGHNGLKSIEKSLHTQNYARLRMGIGRGDTRIPLADYVLSEFTPEENALLPEIIARGAAILKHLIQADLDTVMSSMHCQSSLKEKKKTREQGLGESKT